MIKMKKIVATLTCISMLCFTANIQVKAEEVSGQTVFVDGIEYSVAIDNSNNNVIVKTVGLEENSEMIVTADGDATVKLVDETSQIHNIELEINELSEENVDVVVEENNNIIEEFTSFEELQSDEYIGQVALAAGGTIVVGSLLTALLYASLAVVIAGVTCYAIDSVIKAVRNSNYYYKAYQRLGTVFINPKAIPYGQATSRIAVGADVYTFNGSNARSICVSTGLGVISKPENHKKWYSVGTYLNHYHTANRNGAHSFYGLPV